MPTLLVGKPVEDLAWPLWVSQVQLVVRAFECPAAAAAAVEVEAVPDPFASAVAFASVVGAVAVVDAASEVDAALALAAASVGPYPDPGDP